eukprot:1518392-Alexandrium_andersonii.AAC.1
MQFARRAARQHERSNGRGPAHCAATTTQEERKIRPGSRPPAAQRPAGREPTPQAASPAAR